MSTSQPITKNLVKKHLHPRAWIMIVLVAIWAVQQRWQPIQIQPHWLPL